MQYVPSNSVSLVGLLDKMMKILNMAFDCIKFISTICNSYLKQFST